MANAIIKIYNNHVIKYQIYRYDCIDDSTEKQLLLKNKKLKNEHNTISKNKLVHAKNQNSIRFDSLKRAKDKIVDIALNNNFKYFVTFTFNDKIVNAYDYQVSIKKLKKWLENMVQRNELIYLLVPELHKSGRIHFHALMNGKLKLSDSGHINNSGIKIYNVDSWKYGFSTAVEIDYNYEFICGYITKYITKDIRKITGNFYYAGGNGLERLPVRYTSNLNYEDFEAKEYHIPQRFNDVKYKMVQF